MKFSIQYSKITPELLYSQRIHHEKEAEILIGAYNKLSYLQILDVFVYSEYFSNKIKDKVELKK